jgi:peptidoglycan/LPS O-acetylase OafA/YrhL
MIYHLPDKERDFLRFGSKIEMDAVVIVHLLFSLGLAWVSNRLFEAPCRKYFNLVSDGEG